MTDVVAVLAMFGLAAVVARVLLGATWPIFEHPVLQRTNHAGAPIATATGLVTVLSTFAVASGAAVVQEVTDEVPARFTGALLIVLVVSGGFAVLGFIDDVVGEGQHGGFRAHLHQAARGRLTSGGLKLFGGAVIGVLGAAGRSDELARVIADGALIALMANLINLFDRRPGRATKVSVLILVALAVGVGASPALAAVAIPVGAAVGLLGPELAERTMVGDVGSNAVGAALGAGVVYLTSPTTRSVIVVVLVVLNAASERWSFSEVIERVGPLRWLDQLGRSR